MPRRGQPRDEERPADPASLARYQEMRDFGATPEPAGAQPPGAQPAPGSGARRFVVQEHHATALHWDLRLERDGVLVSWAVPKGVPPDPATNHLAVHTEDHPMEYLTFAGVIPEGSYGAGSMGVWDTGTYDEEKWSDREVMVRFHGNRVQGRYVLFRTGGKNWMIHRMDPPTDPDRGPPPAGAAPMWARPAHRLPSGPTEEWTADVAWGGARLLLAVQGGRPLGLHWPGPDDDPEDVGDRFPELRGIAETLGATEVLADGELVVPGPGGRPDQAALTERLAASGGAVRRLAGSHPAVLMVSDALWVEGHDLTVRPLAERRARLLELHPNHPGWQPQPLRPGDARALRDVARQQGLPGVVVKRLDSSYRPGLVSDDWRQLSVG